MELIVHEQSEYMLPVLYKTKLPVLCSTEAVHVMSTKPHKLTNEINKSNEKGVVIDTFV